MASFSDSSSSSRPQTVWLVCNSSSGSNDQAAVDAVQRAIADAGFTLQRTISFPNDPLPDPQDLMDGGVDMLAVFGGDGTIHSAITTATGWHGAILPLPGGTMNMLSKRLHGDVPAPQIVRRLASGPVRRVRPSVIGSRHGVGLTGVLAGPGAIWNEVREAMRAFNVLEIVASAREAIAHSANGPKVRCEQAGGGRAEGYAAITVTPQDDGLELKGYYAETLGDYAGQGIALLNRDYRDGPHDELGRFNKVRLYCPEHAPIGMLVDGEPFEGGTEETFELAACEIDLVMTRNTAEHDAR